MKEVFVNWRPSHYWVDDFVRRNGLDYHNVQVVEGARVESLSHEHICEHIARVGAALKRYNIRYESYIFNMDQTGCSFQKMVRYSLRKGIVKKKEGRKIRLIQRAIRTKEALNRVTVMPVVSPAGQDLKPIIVYPGKQTHFRRIRGRIQTLRDVLPPWYLYHSESSAVDSAIIYD